jgi:hypothetical protein
VEKQDLWQLQQVTKSVKKPTKKRHPVTKKMVTVHPIPHTMRLYKFRHRGKLFPKYIQLGYGTLQTELDKVERQERSRAHPEMIKALLAKLEADPEITLPAMYAFLLRTLQDDMRPSNPQQCNYYMNQGRPSRANKQNTTQADSFTGKTV